jgi:hypothetical protein
VGGGKSDFYRIGSDYACPVVAGTAVADNADIFALAAADSQQVYTHCLNNDPQRARGES